jgi:hypothetical protein
MASMRKPPSGAPSSPTVEPRRPGNLPFGRGVVEFPPILDALAKEQLPHDWWTIDLCFWPEAWEATAHCKRVLDELVAAHA